MCLSYPYLPTPGWYVFCATKRMLFNNMGVLTMNSYYFQRDLKGHNIYVVISTVDL